MNNRIYLLDIDLLLIEYLYPENNISGSTRIEYSFIEDLYEVLKHRKIILQSSFDFKVIKNKILNRLPIDTRLNNLIVAPQCESEIYKYTDIYGRWQLKYQHILDYTSILDILTAVDAVRLANKNLLRNAKISSTVSRILIENKSKYTNVYELFDERMANITAKIKLNELLPQYNITVNPLGCITITSKVKDPYDILNRLVKFGIESGTESTQTTNAELHKLYVHELSEIRRKYENI